MSTSSNEESHTFIDSNLIEQECIKKHKGRKALAGLGPVT